MTTMMKRMMAMKKVGRVMRTRGRTARGKKELKIMKKTWIQINWMEENWTQI